MRYLWPLARLSLTALGFPFRNQTLQVAPSTSSVSSSEHTTMAPAAI